MDKETYGALKRLVKEAQEYRRIINRNLPIIVGNDIELVTDWIDEVAKEYHEEV